MPAEPPGENAISSEHDVTATDGESPPNRELLGLVERSLDDDKALEPTVIDLAGKTTLADFMVVATGTSQRHIASMAENLVERLKAAGHGDVQAEGLQDAASTWILIDAGDVLVHLFRAETRAFYDIEKLWSVAPPRRAAASS
jgi:ribosome-associated protein